MRPKKVYRQLEPIISKISAKGTDVKFLLSIIKELESQLKQTLRLSNGRLYQERDGIFVLIEVANDLSTNSKITRIPDDSVLVKKIVHYGSYIFNSSDLSEIKSNIKLTNALYAAFTASHRNRNWLFIFDIEQNIKQKDVLYCLNAVRTALNNRLMMDSIESEFEQAIEIQKSLLPDKPPTVPGLDIAGRSQAAEFVGGDLYDYIQLEDDFIGISIGDASGHGLPAALLVRDVVTSMRMGMVQERKILHTIKTLNEVIYRSVFSSRFVSLFYCEIDKYGHLIYVNAGHPPPILLNNDIDELKATGTILGALPDIEPFRAYAHLNLNSVMVMYSDGIIERKNENGENFGNSRLIKLVKQNRRKRAKTIRDLIFKEVYNFGNKANWRDDATVVVVKKIKNNPIKN